MSGMNPRFFLPFENPIGFGISDYIELAAAVLLVCFALLRPWIEPAASRLARRAMWSMLLLAAAPFVLRVALLANHPPPSPRTPAEFSNLLVADTLRHFQFANPPHPMRRFFESDSVSQPVGQGMTLAFGRVLFGHPWAGVVLCVSAFCALCYWMLRAWTTPGWALLGGVLAVLEFGPLSTWMNSYSGGALAGAAGCLVAGSLPRLGDRRHIRDGLLLVAGFAAIAITPVLPALTGPSILLGVAVLRRLNREAARLIVFVCFAQFVLWYGFSAFTPAAGAPLRPEPDHSAARHLVFVSHGVQREWVHNEAAIDEARVVWARDLGVRENATLRRYYPDRKVWLLDAGAPEPELIPYEPRPPEPVTPNKPPTALRFEEVPNAR